MYENGMVWHSMSNLVLSHFPDLSYSQASETMPCGTLTRQLTGTDIWSTGQF